MAQESEGQVSSAQISDRLSELRRHLNENSALVRGNLERQKTSAGAVQSAAARASLDASGRSPGPGRA